MACWLFKSEGDVYPIDALAAEKGRRTCWDGVRNYQARNMMRDEMKKGDLALFYHSRSEPMAIMGVVEIVAEGYPDPSQFDPKSPYHDPKAEPATPRWFMVDIALRARLKRPVTLAELKEAGGFEDMPLTQKGSRLSVQPVAKKHFEAIVRLGGLDPRKL
ncbi:MAG: EVE domain-containing protein [Planctomycetes bacterium]|nr:EVE domain-containing protein [Planctomycetota bacterium]